MDGKLNFVLKRPEPPPGSTPRKVFQPPYKQTVSQQSQSHQQMTSSSLPREEKSVESERNFRLSAPLPLISTTQGGKSDTSFSKQLSTQSEDIQLPSQEQNSALSFPKLPPLSLSFSKDYCKSDSVAKGVGVKRPSDEDVGSLTGLGKVTRTDKSTITSDKPPDHSSSLSGLEPFNDSSSTCGTVRSHDGSKSNKSFDLAPPPQVEQEDGEKILTVKMSGENLSIEKNSLGVDQQVDDIQNDVINDKVTNVEEEVALEVVEHENVPDEAHGQLSQTCEEENDGKSFFNLSLDDIHSEYQDSATNDSELCQGIANILSPDNVLRSPDNVNPSKTSMDATCINAPRRSISRSSSMNTNPENSTSEDQFNTPVSQILPSYPGYGSLNLSQEFIEDMRKSFRDVTCFRSKSMPSASSSSSAVPARKAHGLQFSEDEENEILLSIFYAGNNLGAAVYHTESSKMELMKDIPDSLESFEMLEILLYQVEPDYVLVSARQDQRIIQFVNKVLRRSGMERSTLSASSTMDTSSSSAASSVMPSGLILRPSNEFAHVPAERRMKMIHLPNHEPDTIAERAQLLSAFVDFSCVSMVRAGGALLHFVDKNYRLDETPDVLFIATLTLSTILAVDWATLTSLQVFNSTTQLSGSTAGSWNKRREGLSLFNILNRCSSVVGSRFLRQMLRCPSGSLEVIERRHHDMTFFCNNSNSELCLQLVTSIRKIKNYHRLMRKLSANCMSPNDWQAVARTLNGIVEVTLLSQRCRAHVSVLDNIVCAVTEDIYHLRTIVEKVIDLKESVTMGYATVNPGVDDELDEKRRLHNGLPDLLCIVAREEAKYLPSDFRHCSVEYVPHVGFLLSLFDENEVWNVDFRNIPGLEYVFESSNQHHYRNDRTRALDSSIGDVVVDIKKLEASIISRLSEVILKNRSVLEVIVNYCAQLDCLIALSQVSKEHNWVKPEVCLDKDLVIRDGRHPLQELTINNFIPNCSWMGRKGGRVHVLTGPNSSGKSVYMKQVGLIIFLAHLGCFVPASSARIPIMEKIFIRVNTVESVGLGLSAFMSDLNHLTSALTNLRPRSLLLVDEFGKGTNAVDGASLLAATVFQLAELKDQSPFSIFSTHFHSVSDLLKPSLNLKFLCMKTQVAGADLVQLFTLTEGVCSFSHATEVARKAGVEEDVVNRALTVLTSLQHGGSVEPCSKSARRGNQMTEIISDFLDINLDNPNDISGFLSSLE